MLYEEPTEATRVWANNIYRTTAVVDKDLRKRYDAERVQLDVAEGYVLDVSEGRPLIEVTRRGRRYTWEYESIFLALGRGYSDFVSEVSSWSLDDKGILSVVALEHCSLPKAVIWHLTVDTRAQFLVRQATSEYEGSLSEELSGSGTVWGGEREFPLWTEGRHTRWFRGQEAMPPTTVKLLSYRREFDNDFFDEVKRMVFDLSAPGSNLIDRTVVDSEGRVLIQQQRAR